MANGLGNGVLGNGAKDTKGKPVFRDLDIEYTIKQMKKGDNIAVDTKKKVATLRVGNSGQLGAIKVGYTEDNAGNFGNTNKDDIREGFHKIGITLDDGQLEALNTSLSVMVSKRLGKDAPEPPKVIV